MLVYHNNSKTRKNSHIFCGVITRPNLPSCDLGQLTWVQCRYIEIRALPFNAQFLHDETRSLASYVLYVATYVIPTEGKASCQLNWVGLGFVFLASHPASWPRLWVNTWVGTYLPVYGDAPGMYASHVRAERMENGIGREEMFACMKSELMGHRLRRPRIPFIRFG